MPDSGYHRKAEPTGSTGGLDAVSSRKAIPERFGPKIGKVGVLRRAGESCRGSGLRGDRPRCGSCGG